MGSVGQDVHIVAVDWSGAARRASRKIWLAEVADGRVVRLECGRDRAAIAEHLIDLKQRVPALIVGLDFAFSLPRWFLEVHALDGAPALWRLARAHGERWLAECAPPFWGRPGTRRPEMPDHFRLADLELAPVGGIRPKSAFQVGGAGAVGTGSLRGMPVLEQLRDAGFSIWPFDGPTLPMVVEIYPRALTGPVVKTSEADRARYLERRYPSLADDVRASAERSDDAFDALVSALVMGEHAESFRTLSVATTYQHRIEGRVWVPRSEPDA